MIRLGLCCQLLDSPIKFRTSTAAALLRLAPEQRPMKLADVCRHNALALQQALVFCSEHGIGSFRVNSQILPLKTHPAVGYRIEELPNGIDIVHLFREAGRFATAMGLRLTFHPDQFVVLSSPHEPVVASSLAEIEYQTEVAQWICADAINIHAGGAYGHKQSALERLCQNIDRLSDQARSRLTLENDDRTYTPADLLPVCRSSAIPLVYDVHHHRCLRDDLSIDEATAAAIETWNREPLLHLSSPRDGWKSRCPQFHADYIEPADFPTCWRNRTLTVEIEAKAKQLAVSRLLTALKRRRLPVWACPQAASKNCTIRTEPLGK